MSIHDENSELFKETEKSIVALIFTSMTLGISWYNEINNQILTNSIPVTMNDFEETMLSIKLDCNPSLFLLHSKIISNKQLLDIIISKPYSTNMNEVYEYEVPKASNWQEVTGFIELYTFSQLLAIYYSIRNNLPTFIRKSYGTSTLKFHERYFPR